MRDLKNQSWIFYAIAAGLSWGVWGVIARLIADDVTPYMNQILFSIGMLGTVPLVIRKCKTSDLNRRGMMWGLISGIFAIAGNVAVYQAFTNGGLASIVIPVTNLYPLVTIIIALIALKEKLSGYNIIGIFLAVPAILLLSGQRMLFVKPMTFINELGLNTWFMLSLAALIAWGVFSACQKITTNHISAEWSYLVFIVASAIIATGFLVFGEWQDSLSANSITLGVIAGAINGIGVLSSFAAYRSGKASAVTTIAGSLQPLFTILLAVLFLKEDFTWLEGSGIVLAIGGALLLSYEKKMEMKLVS